MTPQKRRWLRAQLRDLQILVAQFGWRLVLFVAVILCGGAILRTYYETPPGKPHLDLGQACYVVFNLIFFNAELDFPQAQHWGLRSLFFIVPLIGIIFLVEGLVRFAMLLFNKEMRWESWQAVLASTYTDHVILCGLGHVGFRVAEELLKNEEDFVCIALENTFVERLRRRCDHPILVGNCQDERLLTEAQVATARTVIVATDDDLANLETALNARAQNPKARLLVRMFDPELARKVQSAFEIDMAFSTSQLAAPAIAQAARDKSVLHSFYVDKQLLNVVELELTEECTLLEKTLEDLEQQNDITVFVHRRGDQVATHPSATTELRLGDHLLLLCTVEVLEQLEKQGFKPTGTPAR